MIRKTDDVSDLICRPAEGAPSLSISLSIWREIQYNIYKTNICITYLHICISISIKRIDV